VGADKRRRHRFAIGLFGQVGIARKKLVKGGHDLAALQPWGRTVPCKEPFQIERPSVRLPPTAMTLEIAVFQRFIAVG